MSKSMKLMSREERIAHAPMFPLVMSLSIPSMFSMIVQALYNIVDSIFVARYSEVSLTAVSLAFPIQMLMSSVAVGTAVGVNSLISRRLGEGRRDRADLAASNAIYLALISWLVFVVFGLTCMPLFFSFFTKDPVLLEQCIAYGKIVTVFSLGVFGEMMLNRIFQAAGDTIHPMYAMLTGTITNIILDPIMIFGLLGCPRMGIAGAAIATVIGQHAAMICGALFYRRANLGVHINLRQKLEKETVKDIYIVGVPSIFMQAIGSVMSTGMNRILIAFSETAVSVFGIYFKLQSFAFMPLFGLNSGIMPILGYSYGARRKDRIYSALRVGWLSGAVIMIIGTAIFLLFPELLISLFSDSEALLTTGVPALRTICLCFIPASFSIVTGALFQACGQGFRSLIVSVVRQMVVLLPAAYLFSKTEILSLVWLAFPIAELVGLLVSLVLLFDINRKKLKVMPSVPAQETLPQE